MRQREAIRYLFLERREHYTVSEAAALLVGHAPNSQRRSQRVN